MGGDYMEKLVCPNCGEKLVVDRCLSEKDAVMKCCHCKKNFNVSYDEKTFPAKFNSFNWGAFLMGWIWCLGNGKIGLGFLLFLLEAVLISFDKSVKHDLDECNLYHSFCGFSKEFVIDGQPSEVFQP